MVRKGIAAVCICLIAASVLILGHTYAARQERVQEIASEVNGSLTELAGTLDRMVRAYDRQKPEDFEAQYWKMAYQKGRMSIYCRQLQSESELDAKYPQAFSFLIELSGPEFAPKSAQACYDAETVEQLNQKSAFLHSVIHEGEEALPLEQTMQNLEKALEEQQ